MNLELATPNLTYAPVGTRIYFAEEKAPYRIRARSDRYLVCTKPFNPQKTVLYTIVDLLEGVRGPENLVFGFGAETDEQCAEMVKRLHGIAESPSAKEVEEVKGLPRDLRKLCKPTYTEPTQVSSRHRIPTKIVRVVFP